MRTEKDDVHLLNWQALGVATRSVFFTFCVGLRGLLQIAVKRAGIRKTVGIERMSNCCDIRKRSNKWVCLDIFGWHFWKIIEAWGFTITFNFHFLQADFPPCCESRFDVQGSVEGNCIAGVNRNIPWHFPFPPQYIIILPSSNISPVPNRKIIFQSLGGTTC